jgi:hypothetical protein
MGSRGSALREQRKRSLCENHNRAPQACGRLGEARRALKVATRKFRRNIPLRLNACFVARLIAN